MILRLNFELATEQVQKAIDIGIRMGLKRDEPRKAWTNKERKDFVRRTIYKMISNEFEAC